MSGAVTRFPEPVAILRPFRPGEVSAAMFRGNLADALDLLLVEQPLPEHDVLGHARLAAEVETALAADITFGGLAKDLRLARTEIGFEDDNEQFVSGIRMVFTVLYRTRENAPETAL